VFYLLFPLRPFQRPHKIREQFDQQPGRKHDPRDAPHIERVPAEEKYQRDRQPQRGGGRQPDLTFQFLSVSPQIEVAVVSRVDLAYVDIFVEHIEFPAAEIFFREALDKRREYEYQPCRRPVGRV